MKARHLTSVETPLSRHAGEETVLRDLRRIIAGDGVLSPQAGEEKYQRGYRYGSGRALAIARPATTEELAAVVRYCFAHELRIVPQGANTGLVAASTPDASGEQLILSLERLRGIESVDAQGRTATARAGTRLSELNQATRPHELFFPIDLGADPSLGGMIATNTGGARLLRYGDVQKNLMGLEVVLADADATVLSDMKGLRKDNSGIDLKQLFVGTSGSFGIVTRAQVELHRVPRQSATALVVPSHHAQVPELLTRLETGAGEFLSAFEGMSANAMRAALAHNSRLRNPFAPADLPDYAVLIELTSTLGTAHVDLYELMTELLGQAAQGPGAVIADARLGRPEELWAIRHCISDALRAAGRVIGFDISVARSRLPDLRANLLRLVGTHHPYLRVCDFGHCGDGGDHFNIVWPHDSRDYEPAAVESLRRLIYDCVVQGYGGSFSAEHGVGPYNLAYYRRYASAAERRMATQLKRSCDPKGLLGSVDFS